MSDISNLPLKDSTSESGTTSQILALPALRDGEKSLGAASMECVGLLKRADVVRKNAWAIMQVPDAAAQYITDSAMPMMEGLHRQLYLPTHKMMLAKAADYESQAGALAWQAIQTTHGFDVVCKGQPSFRIHHDTIVMVMEQELIAAAVTSEPWQEAGQDAPGDDLTSRAVAVASGSEVTARSVIAESSEQSAPALVVPEATQVAEEKPAPIATVMPIREPDKSSSENPRQRIARELAQERAATGASKAA